MAISPISLFLDSVKSPETRKSYDYALRKYGHQNLSINESKIVEEQIINYILKLKNEGKSFRNINNYISAVKTYYQINNVMLNVKRIDRFMPEQKRFREHEGCEILIYFLVSERA